MIALLVARVLPPLTVAILVAGTAWRLRRWLTATRPKLTLYPAARGRVHLWRETVVEVLTLRSCFRTDRGLWAGTWLFHAALALALLGHSFVVCDPSAVWRVLGERGAASIGTVAGLVVLAAGAWLLARRVVLRRVREISYAEDYVVLALVLLVALTGEAVRFSPAFDANEMRRYFRAALALRAAPVPSHPLFLLHLFLAQLLLMVVPFTKFLHIPGVFFSRRLLLKQ